MLLHVMVTELQQQFSLTVFYPDNSLAYSTFPDDSLTSFKFPEISKFSRQVVNNTRLVSRALTIYARSDVVSGCSISQ